MSDKQFTFHPAQAAIAADTHRFRVARCGRRFGKTWLAAWEMFAVASQNDNARVTYYAPTRDDARDIMWRILKDVCAPLIKGDPNESRLELTINNVHGTTSLIVLFGWEALQERGKGVGVKNNFVVLDEVSKYTNFKMGWEEILRPTLMDLKGGGLFISTTNGFNHFYDLCNKELEDEDYKTFHFTSYDNPYLDPSEIEKMKREMTEDRAAQEIYADFRKKEGLVYKEFSREQHMTSDKPDAVIETVGGVDFGFTHPTAVITVKRDYENNYWVTNEWLHAGKTEEEVAEYVALQRYNKVFPDPENASAVEALKRRGCNVREVKKGKGSIVSGISMIRELLKQNRLKIHKSCTNTLQAFEMYSYAETKGDAVPNEVPDHAYSDMLDALRYAIMSNEGGTIASGPKTHYSNQQPYGRNQINFNKFK